MDEKPQDSLRELVQQMTEICLRTQNGTPSPEDELLLATLQLRLSVGSELRQAVRQVAETGLTLSDKPLEGLPE